jgi:hypothetical protein
MTKKINFCIIAVTCLATLLVFSLAACIKNANDSILGYAPVYSDATEVNEIKGEAPRPIVHAGKIYQYLHYTFQIENGEGIHVINSSDPSSPFKIAFIKVTGCSEISIRNNILYTDNLRDLVGIDISNISNAQLVSRTEGVFTGIDQEFPPVEGVFFECADPAKGTVIAWTQKMLSNPKCKR